MKSVLISIKPKYCELIASGRKTIEVRKTRPSIETQFKCYIYCTLQGSNEFFRETLDCDVAEWNRGKWGERKGKVIGEFVCDRIDSIFNVATTDWNLLCGSTHEYHKKLVKHACLTEYEVHVYAKDKNTLYCWHISDLQIYDKPKELSEFYRKLPEKILESGDYDCRKGEAICIDYPEGGDYCEDCIFGGRVQITCPPQSWCYVEEL